MTTLQKMNASSSETSASRCVRRIERLEEGLLDEERTTARRGRGRERSLRGGSRRRPRDRRSRRPSSKSLKNLRRLVALLDAIDIDSKTEMLRDGLDGLTRGRPHGSRSSIFTQFRDTQSYVGQDTGVSVTDPALPRSARPQGERRGDRIVPRPTRASDPDLNRGRRRGAQPAVLPHDGQLRPALEPDADRATHRPRRPHRAA